MLKNLIKSFLKWKHRNNLQWRMDNGYAVRGRTENDSMGGANLKVSTNMTARHLRNGEEIGRRNVKDKKVTTAFVNFIVAQLQTESSIFGDFKYHDSGTGVVAENSSDVGLGTPTGLARVVGSQEEGSQTYEYKSIGTITYDAGYAITEHGLFNAASGVTLMDRTVFSAINVALNDQIEFTFTIQFSAEA